MIFEKFGTGQNNIIFLHGWGAGKSSFLWLKDYIKNACLHFASLDGFDSVPPPEDPTIAGYATRLRTYIEQNNLKNVILVGHSFGGRVAIEYCNKYKAKKLILVDSAGIKPKFSFKKYISVLKYKLTKRLVKAGLANKDRLLRFGSRDYKNADEKLKKVFLFAVNYDQSKLLKNISVPTLIVWGTKDLETPMYMAKRFNKSIKNSELVLLDGGHFCFLDEPYKFFKVLEYFVEHE